MTIQSRCKERLLYLFFIKDAEHARFFLSLLSLSWALHLILTGIGISPIEYDYSTMELLAPISVWVFGHLFLSAITIYSLVLGFKDKWLNEIEPIFSFFLWTSGFVCLILGDYPYSYSVTTHLLCAAFSWWLLLRGKIKIIIAGRYAFWR